MLTTSEKNTCLMIAKGELREKDLNKPLTKEQKALIKFNKQIIKERKKLGLYDLIDAMSVE